MPRPYGYLLSPRWLRIDRKRTSAFQSRAQAPLGHAIWGSSASQMREAELRRARFPSWSLGTRVRHMEVILRLVPKQLVVSVPKAQYASPVSLRHTRNLHLGPKSIKVILPSCRRPACLQPVSGAGAGLEFDNGRLGTGGRHRLPAGRYRGWRCRAHPALVADLGAENS